MNAQLERLSTGEIRALIDEANAILTERQTEERRLLAEQKRINRGEGGSWREHELVNCGNCKRCAEGGRHHGPYWYLGRYTGSRMVSRYSGRRLSEEMAGRLGREELADRRPEDVFPESYAAGSTEER